MINSPKYLTRVISTTLGLRLFSMLTIIPFLSAYALNLEGGAPWLTGYALGIFGLTQALLQIPFGILSDKIGYKKMMIAGLIMLIIGLLTAAFSKSIYGLILARALQGSGAIVTVGYSWISSVSTDEQRDFNLAKLGTVIGLFTLLSYTVGPLVHIVLSVSGMFVFSAVLVILTLLWVLFGTRQVKAEVRKQHKVKTKQQRSAYNKDNLVMGLMLSVNSILMLAFFFILPLVLEGVLETNKMWMVLTPAILIAIMFLKVSTRIASKRSNIRLLLVLLTLMQGLGFLFIYFEELWGIAIGATLLTAGSFSTTTIVPILLNRNSVDGQRGKSNGIMVSLQYFGSFLGAALTGTFWNIDPMYAYLFAGTVTLFGLVLIKFFPVDA